MTLTPSTGYLEKQEKVILDLSQKEIKMLAGGLSANFNSQVSWSCARRSVLIQKVVCAIKNCSVDLIPFEEVRTRLHLNQKLYRGVQEIKLERIRGSVGRCRDFTSTFLPRSGHLCQRWQRVRTGIMLHGMPPIEVYQVGDDYFVVDGNHRVSIARQEGWKTIEAYVYEFIVPNDNANH